MAFCWIDGKSGAVRGQNSTTQTAQQASAVSTGTLINNSMLRICVMVMSLFVQNDCSRRCP